MRMNQPILDRMLPLQLRLTEMVTPLLTAMHLHPLVLTAVALGLGLEAAWAFSYGSDRGDALGAVSWLVAGVCATAARSLREHDDTARYARLVGTSVEGLTLVLLFMGLGIGVSAAEGTTLWWRVGLVAAFGAAISAILAFRRELAGMLTGVTEGDASLAAAPHLPQFPGRALWLRARVLLRTDLAFVVLLLAGLDLLWLLLAMAAVGTHLYWLSALFITRRQ